MKRIATMSELILAIENREEIYQENDGKRHVFNFILLLQTPLIDLMRMVKQKSLYREVIH